MHAVTHVLEDSFQELVLYFHYIYIYICILGTELRLPDMVAGVFTQMLNHLSGPVLVI